MPLAIDIPASPQRRSPSPSIPVADGWRQRQLGAIETGKFKPFHQILGDSGCRLKNRLPELILAFHASKWAKGGFPPGHQERRMLTRRPDVNAGHQTNHVKIESNRRQPPDCSSRSQAVPYNRLDDFISRLSTKNNFWHRVCSLIWLPFAWRSGIT